MQRNFCLAQKYCMVKNRTKISQQFRCLEVRAVFMMLCSLMLAACGSVPKPDLTPNAPAEWRNHTTSSANSPTDLWWTTLKDPVLNETVELALKNNLTVAQSYERLNAERALEKATLASQKPRFGFYLGPNSSVAFANYRQSTAYIVGFDLQWELPYTAKNDGQRAIAKANIDAASAGMIGARASIVAEVVRVYGELRAANQKVSAIKKMVAYQEAIVQMYERSLQVGAVSQQDLTQVQTRLFELRSVLSDAQLMQESTLQRLDVLCGLNAPLQNWLDLPDAWQIDRAQVSPFSVPVQLIMERPDVQASIAAVMRAAGQVGISEAELYPRIGVEGAVYYSGTIVKNGSTVKDGMLSFLVPNLRFPIYDWGMAREQKNASEAELRRTILSYRETVLQAIADTEMAIANFNAMNERMQRSIEEAQNLAQAAERNKSGLQAGYLSPLDAFNGNIKLLERKLANIDDQSLWLTAFAGANKAQTSMKLEKANIQSSQVEATK